MCRGFFQACLAEKTLKTSKTIDQFNELNRRFAMCSINDVTNNELATQLYDTGYYTPTKRDIGTPVENNSPNINALIMKIIGTDDIVAINQYRLEALILANGQNKNYLDAD